MPASASRITLESGCAFPPHHATVKGRQQPFLISVIPPEDEKIDTLNPHVWKLQTQLTLNTVSLTFTFLPYSVFFLNYNLILTMLAGVSASAH